MRSILKSYYDSFYVHLLYRSSRLSLNAVYSIDQLVLFLQYISASESTTDDLVHAVLKTLETDPLNDVACHRLSDMFLTFGDDKGMRGYAVSLVWSTYLQSLAHSENASNT